MTLIMEFLQEVDVPSCDTLLPFDLCGPVSWCYLREGWGMKVLTLGVGEVRAGGGWEGQSYEFSQLSAVLGLLPLVLIWQQRGRGCKPAGLNPTAEPLTPTSIRPRLPWQGSQSQTPGEGASNLSDRWEGFHACSVEFTIIISFEVRQTQVRRWFNTLTAVWRYFTLWRNWWLIRTISFIGFHTICICSTCS